MIADWHGCIARDDASHLRCAWPVSHWLLPRFFRHKRGDYLIRMHHPFFLRLLDLPEVKRIGNRCHADAEPPLVLGVANHLRHRCMVDSSAGQAYAPGTPRLSSRRALIPIQFLNELVVHARFFHSARISDESVLLRLIIIALERQSNQKQGMLHLIRACLQDATQRLVIIRCVIRRPVVNAKQCRAAIVQHISGLYPIQDAQLDNALQIDRLRAALQIAVGVRFNAKAFTYFLLRHSFGLPCIAQTRTNSFIVDVSHISTFLSVFTRSSSSVIAVKALGAFTF